MEKLILRSRNNELPQDLKAKDISIQNMYWATLEFESDNSFYDDWLELYKNMHKLKDLSVSMGAPDSIINKTILKGKWCDSLYYSYVDAIHERDSSINQITGRQGISLASITKDKAEAISEIAYRYKHAIRKTGITTDFISIVNSRYGILSDLKRWAQRTVDKLELYSELFKWLSLVLYILGTSLAIYGKWLETKEEKIAPIEEL
jgi:hypothetical protein